MNTELAHAGVKRLFDDLRANLVGRWRPLVPHGFVVEHIETTDHPNAFMPESDALAEHETRAWLKVPVIWKVGQGWPTRASEKPTTENLEELRELIARMLASGEYWELRASELSDWSATLSDGPRPSPNAAWTVEAVIRSS